MKRLSLLALLALAACSSESKPAADAPATTPSAPPTEARLDSTGDPVTTPTAFWEHSLREEGLAPEEVLDQYGGGSYDYRTVWATNNEYETLGFIGDDYQRLRVVITAAYPDSTDDNLYHVTGKTKVRNTICPFKGTIRLQHIRVFKNPKENTSGEEAEYVEHRGVAVSRCEFREVGSGSHAGTFTGMLTSWWYIPVREVKARYDDLAPAEGEGRYTNNAFVGEWRSYDGKLRKRVRWGDGHIPDAGDLDAGGAEFMPAPQYEKNGWQSYAVAMRATDEKLWEKERAPWW